MARLQYLPAFITDYRIGYSPQRPYPWRWTTPLALFILFASAALLTCLNIPLSAYEIVQEFTYYPNATLAALPMSSMIPSFLHAPKATFAPTNITATVGRNVGESSMAYQYYVYAISGFVSCTSPTLFQVTWGLPTHGGLDLFPLLDYFGADLQQALWYG
ncbi:hypothetical protein MVEN_00334100 [Mycena venus]|uniref:Uncharacterized protein n=1 Tax=Mycena venus TaxID=2733690 RepID=A0A8H7D9M3_9AGAR|nr:hypothetical protein MVEN_00334100 [Mycena venus]